MSVGVDQCPVEIVEHIFSFLLSDSVLSVGRRRRRTDEVTGEDLRSCSLVSPMWRSIAQALLFLDVNYTLTELSHGGGTEWSPADGPLERGQGAMTFKRLYGFFVQCPTLASSIRILGLNYTPASFDADLRQEHSLDHESFSSLLSHCIHLRELRLDSIVLKDFCSTSPRPSIQLLGISYNVLPAPFVTAQNIVTLILSFEGIDTLVLHDSKSQKFNSTAISTRPGAKLNVSSLYLPKATSQMRADTLHTVLSHCCEMQSVRKLELAQVHLMRFQDVFDDVKSNLTSLTVKMQRIGPSVLDSPAIPSGIRKCNKLRELTLEVILSTFDIDTAWQWTVDGLCNFIDVAGLSSSTHPDLQELVLLVSVGAESAQLFDAWHLTRPLEDMLFTLLLRSSLRKVTFRWAHSCVWGCIFQGFVRKAFPVLHEKGMLVVHTSNNDGLTEDFKGRVVCQHKPPLSRPPAAPLRRS